MYRQLKPLLGREGDGNRNGMLQLERSREEKHDIPIAGYLLGASSLRYVQNSPERGILKLVRSYFCYPTSLQVLI